LLLLAASNAFFLNSSHVRWVPALVVRLPPAAPSSVFASAIKALIVMNPKVLNPGIVHPPGAGPASTTALLLTPPPYGPRNEQQKTFISMAANCAESSTGMSSQELADDPLEHAGVAALSGASFGAYGEGCLRFSYATSLANIEEALRRVETAVRTLVSV